jgi:hypothetical protein
MPCVFGLKLQVIKIIPFNIFAEFRSSGIVVAERNTDPWELDPNPSFIVVEGGFDVSHSVILSDFAEGVLDFVLGAGVDHLADLVHVEVDVLVGGGLTDSRSVGLIFFHKLLQQLQVMISELLPVHRHVHVQLLDFAQNPQV